MRSRTLKPGFFENEELGELDPLARLLFAGLWCYADREGRFRWIPTLIKSKIFPYGIHTSSDIQVLMESLRDSALILHYSVNGKEYGLIPKFDQHQRIHPRESPSKIPPYEEGEPKVSPGQTQGEPKDTPRCPVSTSTSTSICSSSIEAAQLLKDLLLKEKPNAKTPADLITGKNSWANEIDRMVRIDNRDPPEIQKMIRWIYKENLEKEIQFVVQSAQSLRKKYDRIETQMKKHEPRIALDPHKDRRCKTCLSWQDTPNWLNEQGYCERCETLPPN